MLKDITNVHVKKGYALNIQFEDGFSGEVDISEIVPFEGVFAPLKDIEYFKTVHVNPDIGTICWDNGADISPSTLYEIAKKSAH